MSTSDTQLHYLSIRQAGELIQKGELSPVELTRACLDRIQATDDRLNSFILLLADDALEQARTAEAEVLRGDYKGPMHGVPFALKDLYDTAGVRTTSGSYVDLNRVPTEDATTTARLKEAGGILLGSWRCMSSPWAARTGRRLSSRPATPGTSTILPAAPAAVPARRWHQVKVPGRWVPAPGAPSVARLRCAASSV